MTSNLPTDQVASKRPSGPLVNGWVAFCFGCVAILVVLAFYVIAFFLPPPSDVRILEKLLDALQVVLALASAGVAAVVPGWLSVKLKWRIKPGALVGIDAGGAMAVFLLVFLVDPSSLTKSAVQRRLVYDEQIAHCAEGVRWEATRPPRSGALGYCLAAIEIDGARWEAYRHAAAYYYYFRDYQKVREYYADALRAFTGSKTTGQALSFAPSRLQAPTFIQLLRGILIGEVGTWLDTGALDRGLAQQAIVSALSTYRNVRITDAQLLSDLRYGNAMLKHIVWRLGETDSKEVFEDVRKAWREYFAVGRGSLTWAHYDLACLYAEVLRRPELASSTNQDIVTELQGELDGAISAVINEKELGEQNIPLMQCMLFGGDGCIKGWAGDPLDCVALKAYLGANSSFADHVRGRLALKS